MPKKTWKKLPALTEVKAGFRSGCLNCGPQPVVLNLRTTLAVGFGWCRVTKDGEELYVEAPNMGDAPNLSKFERLAKKDPNHDWRASFNGAMGDSEYQRHGDKQWVLIKKGMGFA